MTTTDKTDHPPQDIFLNDGVFWVQNGEVARLLDFERGRFFALDRIGAQILGLSLELGRERAIAEIAEHYEVPQDKVAADSATLIEDLTGRGLVTDTKPDAKQAGGPVKTVTRAPKQPGMLTIRLQMALIWVLLRTVGWNKSVRLLARSHKSTEVSEDRAAIAALDDKVRRAAARSVVLPMECKERALTLHHFLRARYGLEAELCVGIQPHPFTAHAWVERDGKVLTDDPAHCELYTVVARYA